MRLASDASDEIIVRSTIELAHNMGLVVVAEGVEDEAAVSRLRTLGCDMMQGYWLSRPLAEDQVAPWMRASAFVRSAERPQLRRAG
jgi:EAL domain-containing protein (putative c-di-GMP-specific phosphodiesterase class I)